MEDLKKLVENFAEYTTTISITEEELFENLGNNRNDLKTREDFLKVLKEQILYDFIFNIEGIKKQINFDLDVYNQYGEEYKEIQKMIEEIKKIFPNFKIL